MKKNIIIVVLWVVVLGGVWYWIYHRFYAMNNMSYNKIQSIGDKNTDRKNNMNNNMWVMNDMMWHANVVSEEQFIRDMIPHHQEAVDTSKEIVARGVNAEEKQLAQNIIDAQTKEIAMMQWWLKDWYANSTWTANYKNMMPNLTIVSWQSLDVLYLQWMMMHHAGAIAMAEWVLKLNPRDEIKDFANAVIEAQSKEIDTMQQLMMAWMPKGMQRWGMMRR